MIRSMLAAVTGLRNHQRYLDVVGNNIANVSTTGFKSSGVVFQDILSQTLRPAGAPGDLNGGTNPSQIGLGSSLAAIPLNFGQGVLQITGRYADLAIEGDGLFVVESNGERLYTRAGALSLDADGTLVTPAGGFLQGWSADQLGNIDATGPLGNLRIPVGAIIPPNPTTSVAIGGRLSTSATAPITNGVVVYDDQGSAHDLTITYTPTAPNTWDIAVTDGAATTYVTQTVTFDTTTGRPTPTNLVIPAGSLPGVWTDDVAVDFGAGNPDGLVQFGGTTTATVLDQNGAPSGELRSFAVSTDGVISGVFSNGETRGLGQIALAVFNNPEGLEKVGGSLFRQTLNSGLAQVGAALAGGRGQITSGALEGSNVDLAQEFTSLIMAQRGFQANARVVSTSDETLQEIVNLRR